MYSRCGCFASAHQVFDEIFLMVLSLLELHHLWLCQNGFPNEALGLYEQMLSNIWVLNDVTVLSVLWLLVVDLGIWRWGNGCTVMFGLPNGVPHHLSGRP